MPLDKDAALDLIQGQTGFIQYRQKTNIQLCGSRGKGAFLPDSDNDGAGLALHIDLPCFNFRLEQPPQHIGVQLGLLDQHLHFFGDQILHFSGLGFHSVRVADAQGAEVLVGGDLLDGLKGGRLRYAGLEFGGDDAGALGNGGQFHLLLHAKGVLHRLGDLLVFDNVQFGKGQDQNKEAHQQGHEVGKGRHPQRRARGLVFVVFVAHLPLFAGLSRAAGSR